jgi:carbon-monoxide dehydrogenase small subunit
MSTTSMKINFVLNGERVSTHIEPHQSLLEVLRKDFQLYGARESCGQGLCGCCTVMLNGESVSGCLSLAATADGGEVSTIEHLDSKGKLDPVQEAFIECGAFQCGFCTSGFIMMSRELLEMNPDPSESEIKSHLSGNLCRCAAYPEIISAVKLAAQKRKEELV